MSTTYQKLATSAMSKMFEKFATDPVQLEKTFRKYPKASAMYVAEFFDKNIVGEDTVIFKDGKEIKKDKMFLEDEFTSALTKKLNAPLPAYMTGTGEVDQA